MNPNQDKEDSPNLNPNIDQQSPAAEPQVTIPNQPVSPAAGINGAQTSQKPASGLDIPAQPTSIKPVGSPLPGAQSPLNQPAEQKLAPASVPPASKTKLKLWLLITIGVVVLVSVVASYLLFFYLPNRPETVYRRGLDSVGSGLESIIVETDFLERIRHLRYNGQVSLETDDQDFADILDNFSEICSIPATDDSSQSSVAAALDGQSNLTEGDGLGTSSESISFSLNNEAVLDIQSRLISETPAELPRLYFYIKDTDCLNQIADSLNDILSAFSGDLPEAYTDYDLNNLLDQWWFLDIQEIASVTGDSSLYDAVDTLYQIQSLGITESEDYNSYRLFVVELTRLLQTYIFTDNPEKMVFQMDSVLDSQADYKGTKSIRYSTTINRQNLTSLLQSIETLIEEHWSDYYQARSDEEIEQQVDDMIDSTSIEIWVDKSTKVLRNLRLSDKDPQDPALTNHLDIGIDLDRAAKTITLQFEVLAQSEADLKPSIFSVDYTINPTADQQRLTFKIDISSRPQLRIEGNFELITSGEETNILPPEGAKSVIDLLEELTGITLEQNSRNTQRKNDVQAVIWAIQGWINNNNGKLPSVTNNNPALGASSGEIARALSGLELNYYSLEQIYWNGQIVGSGIVGAVLNSGAGDNHPPGDTTAGGSVSATQITPQAEDRDFIFIWSGADCGDYSNTPDGAGPSRSLAIAYVIEAGSGGKDGCVRF